MDELNNIIYLNDEQGNEVPFEFLDMVEYQCGKYVVLLPADESEEAGEVVILELESEDEDGMDTYVGVDDEAELMAVFEIFKEKNKEFFDFED